MKYLALLSITMFALTSNANDSIEETWVQVGSRSCASGEQIKDSYFESSFQNNSISFTKSEMILNTTVSNIPTINDGNPCEIKMT